MSEQRFTSGGHEVLALAELPHELELIVGRDTSLDVFLPIAGVNVASAITVRLVEPGAQVTVTSLILGSETDVVQLTCTTSHEAPQTTGRTIVRAVLGGHAKLDFSGMIRIAKDAQGSDDFLEQRSLLLSPNAQAVAIPALEILANEVKASHAVAVSPVDPTQLFYLETRGLDATAARQLLVDGFIRALLSQFPPEAGATLERKLATLAV